VVASRALPAACMERYPGKAPGVIYVTHR